MTFAEAVEKARRATLDAWNARQSGATSLADRDTFVALAFAERPGGATWERVVEEINRGLPAGARLSVRTARLAWERNRPRRGEDADSCGTT